MLWFVYLLTFNLVLFILLLKLLEIKGVIYLDFKFFGLFVIQTYSTNFGQEFEIPRCQFYLCKQSPSECCYLLMVDSSFYFQDEDAFFDDYEEAHMKLSELGYYARFFKLLSNAIASISFS